PLRGRGSGRPAAAPPRRTGAGEGRRLPPAAVQPASGLPLQPPPPRSSADTAGRREPRRLEAGPHLVGGDDLRDVLLAVAPGAAEPDMRDQTLLRGFGDPPLSHPEPGGDIDVGHQIHWASLLMPENRRVPSPRARGALGAAHRGSAQGGTIPACAGSTTASTRSTSSHWDHPRVR